MDGVLILAHGSREKQTEATFNKVVDMVKSKVDVLVETAFMEFSEKNIEAGLTALTQKGVTNIKVVPYFLFNGIHIREDIPGEINKFLEKNNSVTIKMSDTLGADDRLANILAERIMG